MDPAWAAITISAVGTIGSVVGAFFGTKIALARVEERQNSLGDGHRRLERLQEEQGLLVSDHSIRIRVLENEMDIRPPPLDYPRRT
jgi:hypothetical protein